MSNNFETKNEVYNKTFLKSHSITKYISIHETSISDR